MTGRRYTEQEIDRALEALALFDGNKARASRALAEEGLSIPIRTLHDWPRRHADKYSRMREDRLPRAQAAIDERLKQRLLDALDTHARVMERANAKLDEGEELSLKELASAQRDLAVAGGIFNQNHNLNLGRPTQVTEHRSLQEIVKRLDALGVRVDVPGVVDSDAVEMDQGSLPTDATETRESDE